jgi:hypothetical protein
MYIDAMPKPYMTYSSIKHFKYYELKLMDLNPHKYEETLRSRQVDYAGGGRLLPTQKDAQEMYYSQKVKPHKIDDPDHRREVYKMHYYKRGDKIRSFRHTTEYQELYVAMTKIGNRGRHKFSPKYPMLVSGELCYTNYETGEDFYTPWRFCHDEQRVLKNIHMRMEQDHGAQTFEERVRNVPIFTQNLIDRICEKLEQSDNYEDLPMQVKHECRQMIVLALQAEVASIFCPFIICAHIDKQFESLLDRYPERYQCVCGDHRTSENSIRTHIVDCHRRLLDGTTTLGVLYKKLHLID